MANEATITTGITCTKAGSIDIPAKNSTVRKTVAGTTSVSGTVTLVAAADTTIDLGPVSTCVGATLRIKNNDSTNYVQLSADGTNMFARLAAGDVNVITLDGAALHAKANTGNCIISYDIIVA